MDNLFKKEFVILDGGMGTMLQRMGLPVGVIPEVYTLKHTQILEKIHRAYMEAGSVIAYTNTFNTNAHKLKESGCSVSEVVSGSVSVAKKVADSYGALTALDVGPIGELLEPTGTLSFDEAYELFREVVTAGEAAGADLIAFETFTDLQELRAAVLAAKENTSLPIFATMSFEATGRSFTGCLAESFAVTMEGLGVDAIGVNCSLGPAALFPVVQRIAKVSSLPLIAKPNAGLPDAKTGKYSMDARSFATEMRVFSELGVQFMGGCCGTDPEFIFELSQTLKKTSRKDRPAIAGTFVCSASKFLSLDKVSVIGERINPTGKKRFQQALKDGDFNYVLSQAIEQLDAGANILDINVGVPGLDETSLMKKYVLDVQATTDLPLQIDSNSPEAIETGLRYCCGKAIINSVNGNRERLSLVLPIAKKYGASVIGLTMDESGIPDTAEERFLIAKNILRTCIKYGIPKRDVFIDCLCMTVSANQSSAVETLKAVAMVKNELDLHTVLGVSNISFGLPNRELINQSFLIMAMEAGLDLPIMNPNSKAMMDAVYARNLLRGFDADCSRFVERFAQTNENNRTEKITENPQMDIFSAISKGLGAESANITKELLSEHDALHIVDSILIPALDAVGEQYEKRIIFLPQLMRSAGAASQAFEVIKSQISKQGGSGVSKGKILLATVKGDIHDIGKNIVKTILSNYGYNVIDLGRDVAPETVVDAAIRENVPLVGLSALMTTTLGAMEETILKLRKSGHPCKIVVGGAVLTPEYAQEIGADYYSKDAKDTVDVAKQVFSMEG